MTDDRSRSLQCSGGPLDGLELPCVFPLAQKFRIRQHGFIHRYVLEDSPKLRHPNGTGHLTLTYRYEGAHRAVVGRA